MIEDLISRVFHDRNAAHLGHWRAPTLAIHLELEEFYKDALKALDALVEAHQGAFGVIGHVPVAEHEQPDLLAMLEDTAAWIEDNHDDICQGIRAIANLIDGLGGVYLTAIYKLRNLQ